MGRTVALFGDSGSGKTTQGGEFAKHTYKERGKKSVYYGADLGGHDSIAPLVRLGVVEVRPFGPSDDPWDWAMAAAECKDLGDDIGLVIFDSATSMSEALLNSCAKLSASGKDIGGRPAPKFKINRATEGTMVVGSNVDSHYMVVQNFMLDVIWRSTWLARERDVDVLWTFSVHRGEKADETPILGPKLAGKALTASIPKWFNYTFRIASIPQENQASRHLLYLQEQPDLGGFGMSFGNSRYPIDSTTPLPPIIEPASISEALNLIQGGQDEADATLRAELSL